jgi:hypothetical protein
VREEGKLQEAEGGECEEVAGLNEGLKLPGERYSARCIAKTP